jgi:hypothetical protein
VKKGLPAGVRGKALSRGYRGFSKQKWNGRFGCRMWWSGRRGCWFYWCPWLGCYLPESCIYVYPPEEEESEDNQ